MYPAIEYTITYNPDTLDDARFEHAAEVLARYGILLPRNGEQRYDTDDIETARAVAGVLIGLEFDLTVRQRTVLI